MKRTRPSKKVLVAVRPDALPIVSHTLGSEFDVIVCHSFKDAKIHLNEQVGLIACGVHFDGGAMFDFLRHAKANPKTQSIPFFLLIGGAERYSKCILDGIRIAAKILGAEGFTDLSRLKIDMGEEDAYERLRQVIRNSLRQDVPQKSRAMTTTRGTHIAPIKSDIHTFSD